MKENEVGRQSEEMGELVTDNLIRKELGDLEDVTVSLNKAGTGDFDRIYKDGDRFIIVEAKGGASTLGSKKIDGKSVQQGNKKYFEAIIENFRKAGKDKLADDLVKSLKGKKIDYYKVKQGFKPDGSLKPTEISKFDLN